MMKFKLMPLLGILPLCAWSQVELDKPVLTINGEDIKGAEYYRRMEFLPGAGLMLDGRFVATPPGLLTMQRLIDERLLLQLAKEKNVAPTDQEVQEEFKHQSQDTPKLLDALLQTGFTQAEFLYRIRVDLAEFKLVSMGVTITDIQVEKFYKDNPTFFTVPKRFKLRVIAVPDEAAMKVVDLELKKGTTFAEVAKRHSIEPSKNLGGEIGEIAVDRLADVTRTAIEKTKIGQTTEWITASGGFIKFYLEDVLKETKEQLDARLRRQIRKQLMVDTGRVKNDLPKMLREMRAKAVIVVHQKQFAEPIQKYVESAKAGG